jgi:hypothetical protein
LKKSLATDSIEQSLIRWGEERFRRIFQRTVQACIEAKIAKGEIVHVDASLTASADMPYTLMQTNSCHQK